MNTPGAFEVMMSDPVLWQVGFSAMFVLYVLRLVLEFLNKRHTNGHSASAGAKPTEYWHKEIRSIVKDELVSILQPFLDRQEQTDKEMLKVLRDIHSDFGKFIAVEKVLRREGVVR